MKELRSKMMIIAHSYAINFRIGIESAMEYEEIVSKIAYITKHSKDEILKKVSDFNMGEPNIETADWLCGILLTGVKFENTKRDK